MIEERNHFLFFHCIACHVETSFQFFQILKSLSIFRNRFFFTSLLVLKLCFDFTNLVTLSWKLEPVQNLSCFFLFLCLHFYFASPDSKVQLRPRNTEPGRGKEKVSFLSPKTSKNGNNPMGIFLNEVTQI